VDEDFIISSFGTKCQTSCSPGHLKLELEACGAVAMKKELLGRKKTSSAAWLAGSDAMPTYLCVLALNRANMYVA